MTCESAERSGITTLSDDFYADECCARFDGDDAQSINRKSSAYPDALLCLTQIGCIDSPIGKVGVCVRERERERERFGEGHRPPPMVHHRSPFTTTNYHH